MEETTATPAIAASKVNLYKKLLQVYKDVKYVQKDGNNSFHKYKYVTEAAVKERMHEAFVSNGLLFQLSVTDLTEVVDGKNRLVTVKFYYKFIDVDTGEYEEGTSYGTGVDSLDKGLYKAIAGGIKYILTSNFLIATGDDPEDDKYEKEQAEAAAAAAVAAKKNGSKTNGKAPVAPAQSTPPSDSGTDSGSGPATMCGVCGSPITEYVSSKGKKFSVEVLIAESTKKYGVPMCATCQVAKGQEAKAGAGARVQ